MIFTHESNYNTCNFAVILYHHIVLMLYEDFIDFYSFRLFSVFVMKTLPYLYVLNK